jgi:hypothetical protein
LWGGGLIEQVFPKRFFEWGGVGDFGSTEAFFEAGEAEPGRLGKAGVVDAFEVERFTAKMFRKEESFPNGERWGVEGFPQGAACSEEVVGGFSRDEEEDAGDECAMMIDANEVGILFEGFVKRDNFFFLGEEREAAEPLAIPEDGKITDVGFLDFQVLLLSETNVVASLVVHLGEESFLGESEIEG